MNTGPANAIWTDRYTLVTLHEAIPPYRPLPIYTVEFREFTPPEMLEIGNPAETVHSVELVDIGGQLIVITPDTNGQDVLDGLSAVQQAEEQFESIAAGDTVPVTDLNLVHMTF